ncbi:molybdopterin cofactor-binding domain-containing protein [Arenibacter sp. GZD96]|uniref:xanthine dehydrogenase family protein molybdopterin-binding subunit n=1 Tax=Aurantibrevibacter litoralis TaxID=3106030 RepID=UPI002AFDFD53|nr:molybdopterin cofactor-binding domain-containing protein [Arenibacter sp. GZD-96]MEA1784673.1 molybdopterin cofactor-binding domain-containing protein [Arenibacter sp. GZD-96]
MTSTIKTLNRRSFLRVSALAGGGMVIGVSWLVGCESGAKTADVLPKEWVTLNGFLKISDTGLVTIMSPNPEGGQNVKTGMPMIVAEELDADWAKVIVAQAPLDTANFTRQFIGGSQAIRTSWKTLRTAGATARQMLIAAASQQWNVPKDEITTDAGMLKHLGSTRSAHYGEVASLAASLPVPEDVPLKEISDFKIIGTSQKNVEAKNIVTGKPLFGIDTYAEGMLTAMIVHPPAFGMKLKSFDVEKAKAMPGIKAVFPIKVLDDAYVRQHFDTCTFLEVIAVVGTTTWEVMNAKKALNVAWEPFETYTEERVPYGGQQYTVTIPAGLVHTESLKKEMSVSAKKSAKTVRRDGNPEEAFKKAAKIVEATYVAPFLAHNCMEPMNFYADVKEDSAQLSGSLQKAELTEHVLAARLQLPLEKIDIQMTRLGGGYGRRSYSHWAVEAALISQKMKAPVKLVYSREDDMTGGIYRPMYQATFRAALDAQNELIGLHVNAGGVPESPLYANRFPAGAVANYLAESWTMNTNITIGSFRAPRSNFMAASEQSFLDEVAEAAGKDPIDFRLELLQNAKENPVGQHNDYDPERYASVLHLLKEKSNWGVKKQGVSRGVAAYFCHNSYAAQVVDVKIKNNQVQVEKVYTAVDCGLVINPDAAKNLCEGAVVDAIGTALYGELGFTEGKPDKTNFDTYRMIRMKEAPTEIETYFVQSEIDPTGLGEPAYPPVFAALANALYKAKGKRIYEQPFIKQMNS